MLVLGTNLSVQNIGAPQPDGQAQRTCDCVHSEFCCLTRCTVPGIVYRGIAAHLIRKAGHTQQTARTGAVTRIQRFGSALNLNIHFHMLFLDGVYEAAPDGIRLRFQWVRAPMSPN